MRSDGDGTFTWATPTDTNTTYTASRGLSLSGTDIRYNGFEIPSAADLNTYRTTGYYTQNANADAVAGTNYPVSAAGILQVINDDYGNGVHTTQLYSQYNTSNYFIRNYYNGTWSAWRDLTQDTNTTYTAGTGISLVGTTFNNTAPDQTVTLTQGGATTITGTYPNFTISSTDTNTTYSVGNGGLTEINFTTALNSKLAGIEAGATADQTAAEILTAIKTVDGAASGLDADLLDGQHGSYYQPASTAITTSNIGSQSVASATTSGSTTGNAATATALQTARTINGVSFNGTANITVADSTKLPLAGGTATGTINAPTFNATSVTNGGFQGIDADTALIPSFTWTSDQNTGMWHLGADQIGFTTAGVNRLSLTTTALTSTLGITAPTFTGALSGNATTATTLQTARTIALAGDVTGSVSFNGSANATITAVVVDDSHNHIIANVDGLQAALDSKGAVNDIFYTNAQVITTSYTLGTGRNAMTAGPVTINAGITVTIPSGTRWVVV